MIQFASASKISKRLWGANNAVNQITDLRSQRNELQDHLEKDEKARGIVGSTQEWRKKLMVIQDELAQMTSKSNEDTLNSPIKMNNMLSLLAGTVDSADDAPTEQWYDVFYLLSRDLDVRVLAPGRQIMAQDVPVLNKAMR